MTDTRSIWKPTAEIIADANVTALARKLNYADFDQLWSGSISDPGRYWNAVIDFCGIVWRKPYEDYVDLSRGKEFPVWFPGGRLNWTDNVLRHAIESPGKIAVIGVTESGQVQRVTYSELRTRVRQFANGLKSHGIRRGDRIGLLMENGIDATVTFLAISYIGGIVVPLFSGFGSDAIRTRLQSCGARTLIATSGFERRGRFVDTHATLEEVRHEMGADLEIILRLAEAGNMHLWPGCVDWQRLAEADPADDAEEMTTTDPFMIIFTSGTTGRPKGTVHTHAGFPIRLAHDSMMHFNVKKRSVYCWPADMGWIAGAVVLTSALSHGATLVCYDGAPDFPDWSRLPKLIEEHRITHFGSAPTLIRGLAANAPTSLAADMSSIELLITAGESIAPEHFTWFQENIGPGNTPVINYTGGSEASGALLASVVTKPIPSGMFNVASPGVDADIVDARGNSVTGEVGELAIRQPFIGMTQGFWEDDERYLETYWRTLPGVWIHGDLAIRDEAGRFVLVGRSDDTIKIAGKRVGPAEVEEIVVEIAGISEAAVIGVADPVKGQAIAVFVTLGTGYLGGTAIQEEVKTRIQARLGKPFSPRAVHIVKDLPKTRSTKVMRRVIRSVYSGEPAGDISSLVNPESVDEIREIIKQFQTV